MKSSSFPSVRVEPALRQAAEEVLKEGETLSSFVELSIRSQVERRKLQEEFVARGLRSLEDAERTGRYHSVEDTLAGLDRIIAKARARQGK